MAKQDVRPLPPSATPKGPTAAADTGKQGGQSSLAKRAVKPQRPAKALPANTTPGKALKPLKAPPPSGAMPPIDLRQPDTPIQQSPPAAEPPLQQQPPRGSKALWFPGGLISGAHAKVTGTPQAPRAVMASQGGGAAKNAPAMPPSAIPQTPQDVGYAQLWRAPPWPTPEVGEAPWLDRALALLDALSRDAPLALPAAALLLGLVLWGYAHLRLNRRLALRGPARGQGGR